MLVAVAWGGAPNKAAWSADGATWTRATCPSGDWRRVISDGAGFIAVGTNAVMRSPDGIAWSSATIPSGNWRGVCSTPSGWLAVAERTGANRAATSPDGATWTARPIPSGDWRGCASGGGVTVAVEGFASAPSVRAARSTDHGVSWSTVSCPSGQWISVSWSPTLNLFCAVANDGPCMTSPDGATWTARSIGTATCRDVVWSGTRFVAVAFSGAIAQSTDGITWTPIIPGFSANLTGVAADPAAMAVCAEAGAVRLARSADGLTWTPATAPVTDAWHDIAGTWTPPPTTFPGGWSVGFLKF